MRWTLLKLTVVGLLATSAQANLLTNGDWSTGTEAGWTRWNAGWSSNYGWSVTSTGPTVPEGTASFASGQGSFGWYQAVEVNPGSPTVYTVNADWTGQLTSAGWAEVMLFDMAVGSTPAQIVSKIDGGAAADIAYKKDSWGMNPPTTWSWQAASLSPHPSGNGGSITVSSNRLIVVGLKHGHSGNVTEAVRWDNIVLTPEPGAIVLMLLGLAPLMLRRRHA